MQSESAGSRLPVTGEPILSWLPFRLGPRARYAAALGAPVLTLLIQIALLPRPAVAPFVLLFAGVALASLLGGLGPGLLSVALSAALADYFFLGLRVDHSLSQAGLRATALFVVSAALVSFLCAAFRRAIMRAEKVAAELRQQARLLELSHDALLESERRSQARATELQTVLDLVPAVIWMARDPEAHTIETNRVGSELLERPPGTNVSLSAPPAERPGNFRVMRRGVELAPAELPIQAAARRGVAVRDSELDLVFDDGRVRHLLGNAAPLLDEAGRVRGSVGAFIDITDRQRAEEALRQDLAALRLMQALSGKLLAEGDLGSVLQAVMDAGVFILAAEKGTLQLFEGEALRIVAHHGHSASFLEFFADAQNVASVCGEATRRGERVVVPDVETSPLFAGTPSLEVLRSAGVRAVQSTPLMSRAGALLGILTTQWTSVHRPDEHELWRLDLLARQAADVIDHRRAEDALRQADRRKTEFLALLSHELRNPLAPITNSLYLLEHAAPGGEQARRAQEVIGRQVAQLVRMVDDLLEVTRISSGKVKLQRRRVELGDLARRTIEDHRSLFEASGIRLAFEPAAEPVWVVADPNRIAQVVGNLLTNAAKFTPRSGQVTVSLATDPVLSRAVLRVADDGAGIAPEMLPRLFEPFTQADTTLDRSLGGLGLGLSLVRGLVEQHGGTVAVTSAGVGRGAEFTVRLPLASEGSTLQPVRLPAAGGPARRVLVIEDNRDAADSLRELLEMEGHCVAIAYDGPAGIAAAREFRPEVVLCDIGLPRMDGYEVARALRADQSLRGVRLVALTGYALPEDLDRARAAGFERHLAKPPNVAGLRGALAAARPGR